MPCAVGRRKKPHHCNWYTGGMQSALHSPLVDNLFFSISYITWLGQIFAIAQQSPNLWKEAK